MVINKFAVMRNAAFMILVCFAVVAVIGPSSFDIIALIAFVFTAPLLWTCAGQDTSNAIPDAISMRLISLPLAVWAVIFAKVVATYPMDAFLIALFLLATFIGVVAWINLLQFLNRNIKT